MTTKPYDARSMTILAKTLYKELRANGCESKDVLSFAGELIGMVTSDVSGCEEEEEEEE